MLLRLPLLLIGLGRVGQSFAGLVNERHDEMLRRYGLDLQLAGIATSRALWEPWDGCPVVSLLTDVRRGLPLHELRGVRLGVNGGEAIGLTESELVVDTSPASLSDGEPGLTHLRLTLNRGKAIAVASKGALARHLPELRQLAAVTGGRFRFGAATAGALPTIDLARYGLAGASILRVEGIFNGTTNFILTKMTTGGLSYTEALHQAQSAGIAEPDPRVDVEGWDTAAKLVILAHSLWETDLRLDDVAVRGIMQVERQHLAEAALGGRVIKLIGSLWRQNGRACASVEPRSLSFDQPLAHMNGAEKGVMFLTDTMDRVTVAGGRSDPLGAAAGLLRDVIHLMGRA